SPRPAGLRPGRARRAPARRDGAGSRTIAPGTWRRGGRGRRGHRRSPGRTLRPIAATLAAAVPRRRARPAAARSCGPRLAEHREAEPLARFVVALRDRACERANAPDVSRALRDRDRAARVEQVERV